MKNRFKKWMVAMMLGLSLMIVPTIVHAEEVRPTTTQDHIIDAVNQHAEIITKNTENVRTSAQALIEAQEEIQSLKQVIILMIQRQSKLEHPGNFPRQSKNPLRDY